MTDFILFTTSDRPREYTNKLIPMLSKAGFSSEVLNLDSLVFYVRDNEITIQKDDINLEAIEAVYIKHWHIAEEQALIVSRFMKKNKKKVVPDEVSDIVPRTKFGETFLLALENFPVPDSIFTPDNEWYLTHFSEISANIGVPFIFKSVGGKKGADNYLVSSEEQLKEILSRGGAYIAQAFIDNDGDYRLINFDDEIKIIIKRTRSGDSHMNNTSLGGNGALVEADVLGHTIIQDSLRAVKILKRNIAGIDVVIDKLTGKHYFMEINYSPQITTGTYLEEKEAAFIDYFKRK